VLTRKVARAVSVGPDDSDLLASGGVEGQQVVIVAQEDHALERAIKRQHGVRGAAQLGERDLRVRLVVEGIEAADEEVQRQGARKRRVQHRLVRQALQDPARIEARP